MFKTLFKSILLSALFLFFTAGVSDAAISIRLDQPKSPTNSNSFNVSFVTLDTEGTPITVKCFKKGPSDGGFSQFGGDTTISAGGNSGNCPSVSSFVNTEGTYQFQAKATGSSGTAESSIISVDYKTSGPGTPTNYSKDKAACTYTIKFKTADDSGKTSKVVLYRSESSTVEANEVDTKSIGSNTDSQFENTPPDCSKEYLYALRAFDTAGNSSGVVGDSITVASTTTTTQTLSTLASAETSGEQGETIGGAIPVGEGESAVTKERAEKDGTGEKADLVEEILGEKEDDKGLFSSRNIFLGLLVIAAVASVFVLYKRFKNKTA